MTLHSFFRSLVFAMLLTSVGRGEVRVLPPDTYFELNQGQVDPSVKFVARTRDYRLFLTGNAAVLAALNGQSADTLTMRLIQANQTPQVSGFDQQPGVSNYLTGSDPSGWVTGIKSYAKIFYRQVYPGIDLVYYGKNRRLEHDFVVAPGSDYRQIRIRYDGSKSLRLGEDGELIVDTASGELREPRPVIYQEKAGARKMLAGGYRLKGREVSFKVDGYDPSLPLVIDPAYVYFSTYLGGSGVDQPTSVASDAEGNAYVTGFTTSVDFPVKGPVLAKNGGVTNAFVTKLDGSTGAIIYSTYLGGNNIDEAIQIKVDSTGSAYIAGTTQSTNFPVTPGAYQSTLNGPGNAFVAKLNPAGDALVYSTLLGGSGGDTARGLDIDQQGNAYVVGVTFSGDFPVVSSGFGLPRAPNGFISEINPTGTALVYSGAIGGSGFDDLEGVAVNSLGEANVVGFTNSYDLPTTYEGSRWPTLTGGLDGFMVKLSPGGGSQTAIEYISYYGGSNDDILSSIVVDPRDDVSVYLTGLTSSYDFPSPSGALIGLTPGTTVPLISKFQLPGIVFVADRPGGPAAARALKASRPDNNPFLQTPPPDCPGGDWGPLVKQMKDNMNDYKKFNKFMDSVGSFVRDFLPPILTAPPDFVNMIKNGMDFCSPSSSSSSAEFRGPGLLTSGTSNASPTPLVAFNTDDGTPGTVPELPVGLATSYTSVKSAAGGPSGSIFMAVQTNDPTLPVSSAGAKPGAGGAAGGITGYIIKLAPSAPSAQITSVVNGANFSVNSPVAPGSLITLSGQFVGVTPTTASNPPVASSLGGVSVKINGTTIPLLYVDSGQINAQLPWETAPGQTTAIVTVAGTASAAFSFNVVSAGPGIFVFGANRAVAQNLDYSLNNTGNGAAVGSYVTVYLTGGGAVNPPFATGVVSPVSPLSQVTGAANATIGGQPAPIQFLGMTPGFIGLVQANLQVPRLPAGDYPVVITIGGSQSNAPLVTVVAEN
jgi:uncharacterized protein (TIGR03437 family)